MDSTIAGETYLTLKQVSQMPVMLAAGRRRAGGVDLPTLVRWCRDGCRAENGRRVVLESIRVNGKRLVSRQAVARFIDALNSTSPAPLAEADAARLCHLAAEARLDAAGI